jgi:hypothetical protein
MFLRSISASRKNDYNFSGMKVDYSQPLIMTVTVGDDKAETKLELDAEACARILSVISEELAAQAARVAQAMVASTFTQAALPSPDIPNSFLDSVAAEKALPDNTVHLDDEISF